MKATFKPLGLAAAVAAASVGYVGVSNAQTTLADNAGLGDLAIVPYYTTLAGYSTGISVINTSDMTQVIKIRLRRAVDSLDALDFNVVLSPEDVWTGYVQADGDDIRFYTNDNSCTVPALEDGGYLTMPDIYREGADEGYIEVIGMGSADASQPISVSAKHGATGLPFACDRVRDNFFPGDTPADYGAAANLSRKGVISSVTTHQCTNATCATVTPNTYGDTGNVLKVSYFIKSDATGTEFGNDSVMFADFLAGASMTNQRFGLFDGDLQGFDYPDLNGGASYSVNVEAIAGAGARGAYEGIRAAIGGTTIVNDWSANQTDLFTVDTDWVITIPGQYLMMDQFVYQAIERGIVEGDCLGGDPNLPWNATTGANCDFRDIPMVLTASVWDREERGIVVEEGDLVVSPQPPGEIIKDVLDQEVNVLTWGIEPVLGSAKTISIPKPEGAQAGWAKASVEANLAKTRAICDVDALSPAELNKPTVAQPAPQTCVATTSDAPLVGFVAWQRNFGANPDANYGRIVEHSYIVPASASVAP